MRGQEGEPAVRGEEAAGGPDRGSHLIDGAEGHAVEHLDEGLGAAGVDTCRNAGDADGFAEEGGFFVLRLGEGDADFRPADGDGNSGEAGTGTVVEECGDPGRKRLRAGDGFEEVALEDAAGIADGGEIGAGVPTEEERKIIYKSFILFRLDEFQACRGQELCQAVARIGGHGHYSSRSSDGGSPVPGGGQSVGYAPGLCPGDPSPLPHLQKSGVFSIS